MKQDVLLLASIPSPSVMAQLEQHFQCHHAWRMGGREQDTFIAGVAPRVRAVVVGGATGIDAAMLARLPIVELVAVSGIGVDAVDFTACRPRGIQVTNTPGVLTDDVADLGLTLLLAAARGLPGLDRYVRAGLWEQKVPVGPTRSLRGTVAGIVGFGQIGRAMATRVAVLGMQVRYFQPRALVNTIYPRAESLLALANESDYLLVCAPGGAANRHMIDAAVIAALGPQGTLINIGRGNLVDEAALITALQNGGLRAAALDVYADEPYVPAALRALNNVVLTPHVASLTVESRHAMGQLVVDNLLAHFSGKPLLTRVAPRPT
jgi:lactate dehydrogenase-like 2-hydroxyacid dehydrogenase